MFAAFGAALLLAAAPAPGARASAGATPAVPDEAAAAAAAVPSDPSSLWRAADAADHHERDYAKAIALYGRLLQEFPAARLARMAAPRRAYLVHATAGGEEPLRRFDAVRDGWSSMDHAQAEAEVEAIAKEFPDAPIADEVLLWLGDRAADEGRWAAARTWYRTLLDRFPASDRRGYAYGGIGRAEFQLGNYDAAEKAYAAIAGTGIPGADQVAAGERERVVRHLARRHGLEIAIGVLLATLALGAATVDARRIAGAARRALGREVLYVAPLLAVLALVAPADARAPIAGIGAAGIAVLLIAVVWAEAARPALARPAWRAISAAVATAAGAAAIYSVMYALDVLVALEKVVGI